MKEFERRIRYCNAYFMTSVWIKLARIVIATSKRIEHVVDITIEKCERWNRLEELYRDR